MPRAAHVQHVLAPGWAGHEGPDGLLLEDRPAPKNFMAVPLLSAGTGISAMLPSSSVQRAAGRCPARSGRRRRRGASNWAKSARVHAPRAGRLAGDSRGLAKHNKKKARWSAACTPKRSLSGGHARARAMVRYCRVRRRAVYRACSYTTTEPSCEQSITSEIQATYQQSSGWRAAKCGR